MVYGMNASRKDKRPMMKKMDAEYYPTYFRRGSEPAIADYGKPDGRQYEYPNIKEALDVARKARLSVRYPAQIAQETNPRKLEKYPTGTGSGVPNQRPDPRNTARGRK
jgi:hypothetical protein